MRHAVIDVQLVGHPDNRYLMLTAGGKVIGPIFLPAHLSGAHQGLTK